MIYPTHSTEMKKAWSPIFTENGLFFFAALLFGHFMVALDNIPLPALIQKDWYYRDFALASVSAWLILKYVSFSSGILDRRCTWANGALKRIIGQLIFGVGGAALAAYLISFLQYKLLDPDHVFGTESFSSVEYPVIVLLAICVNFVHVALSLKSQKEPASEDTATSFVGQERYILVESGHNKIPLPIDKVAYFRLDSALTWVCTFDNERYRIDKSLSELMPELPLNEFFRVNRQTIIHIRACQSYKSEEFGKISIGLIKPLSLKLYVSQKTAPMFRKWIGHIT